MPDKELFISINSKFAKNHSRAELLDWIACVYDNSEKPQFSPAENVVMMLYPQFKTEYQILIDNGYMQKNGDYLRWLKTKKCLAAYFGDLHKTSCKQGKISWREIEKLFDENGLAHFYSRNGNAFKTVSKDYEKLQDILKFTRL